MAVDQQVKQMMEELGKAVAQAIRSSVDVSEAIRKIRHQGMSPHLVLSCERDVAPTPGDSEFRLNGRDVALLKSMGIDPTRRGRTPRRRRRRRANRQRQGSTERRRS